MFGFGRKSQPEPEEETVEVVEVEATADENLAIVEAVEEVEESPPGPPGSRWVKADNCGKAFTSTTVPFQANAPSYSANTSTTAYAGLSAPYSTQLNSGLSTPYSAPLASSFNSSTIPFQANTGLSSGLGLSTPYSAPLASSFNSSTIPFQANTGLSSGLGLSTPYSAPLASSYAAPPVNLAGDNAGARFYEKYSSERDRQYRSTIDKTATLYQQSNLGKQVSGSYSTPLSTMASSFNSTNIPFQANTGLSGLSTPYSTPLASSCNSSTIPFRANTGLSSSYSTPLASSLGSSSLPLQTNAGFSTAFSNFTVEVSALASSAAGEGDAGNRFYEKFTAERDRKLREGIDDAATLL